jgi:sporulation protein YlmC with PRC-barrel domain
MKAQWGRMALTAILSVFLVSGIAVANEYTNQSADQTTKSTDQTKQFQPNLEKAKDLIGAKVFNRDGTRLGTIEDIVLTPHRDAISYVALSYGGTLGIGNKLFAVPWSAFEMRPQEQGKVVVLNVDENYLKTAQGFDKEHWPMVADRNWPQGTAARNVPGEQPRSDEGMAAESHPQTYSPQATERTGPGMAPMAGTDETSRPMAGTDIKYLRLSKLIGTTVKNSEGVDIGKLNNVMLDVNGGKVAYGILSVDRSFLGTSGKLAAIPWSAIQVDEHQGTAMLNVDKDTLQAIAFDENHFPNLADPQYSRDLYQRFNVRPYWEALGFVPSEQNRPTATPEASNPGAADSEHGQPFGGMDEPAGD